LLIRTRIIDGVSVLYGLFFACTGCWITVAVVMGWPGPRQPTIGAQALTDALDASRIIDPLLAMTYIVGGVALMFRRTAPLGVVLLAPAIGTIFFFHLVLSGQFIWGSANALCFAALAWRNRGRLSLLWSAEGMAARTSPATAAVADIPAP